MTFQNTDKILVNRDGVDYKADIEPLLKKPIIERWTALSAKEITTETAPFAVGDSSCRPGYRKYSVKGSPHDIKLEDGSFGYIMPVVCGGGNQWGETGSLMIVNKQLEEQKIIKLPNANGLMNGGHIMCYPYLDKDYFDYGQPALEFNNILVWSDTTGIWGSFDYGDSWTQFKGYNGDSWIPTDENCRLAFQIYGGLLERSYIRFDGGDQTSFNSITGKFLRIHLEELGDPPRGCEIGLEGLLHTDLLDMEDPEGIWDYTTEKVATETFPENHEVLSWHYETEAYFRDEENKIANDSHLKHFKVLHAHSTGARWNKGDSKDDIFDIYVTEFGQVQMANWKADFHKRWIRSIPDHDLKDGAYFLPEGFLLCWDSETEGYFSRYHDNYRWQGGSEDNRNVAHQVLWTSQTLQDTVIAYHASAPFLDGESPDTRNGESGVSDVDEYGCWITRLGTTALMRFGTHWEWSRVDAPTKGQENGWGIRVLWPDNADGEVDKWVISLPDKRLWSGSVVTTIPVYSLKDGYLIEGEFIEAVYPEAAQMFHPTLVNEGGGGADHMPLDINTLPTLT